jgi:hypothetical protein
MRQQYRKLEIRHDSRTDLILENVGKQVALLEKQGNLDGAERVLRIALTDKGREVVAFRELAAAYVAFAHRHNRQRDALRFICSKFAECLPEPHGDYFAMRAYASLSQVLADILEKDGQESKARRLRKDAERLEKSAHNLVTSGLE